MEPEGDDHDKRDVSLHFEKNLKDFSYNIIMEVRAFNGLFFLSTLLLLSGPHIHEYHPLYRILQA